MLLPHPSRSAAEARNGAMPSNHSLHCRTGAIADALATTANFTDLISTISDDTDANVTDLTDASAILRRHRR